MLKLSVRTVERQPLPEEITTEDVLRGGLKSFTVNSMCIRAGEN